MYTVLHLIGIWKVHFQCWTQMFLKIWHLTLKFQHWKSKINSNMLLKKKNPNTNNNWKWTWMPHTPFLTLLMIESLTERLTLQITIAILSSIFEWPWVNLVTQGGLPPDQVRPWRAFRSHNNDDNSCYQHCHPSHPEEDEQDPTDLHPVGVICIFQQLLLGQSLKAIIDLRGREEELVLV